MSGVFSTISALALGNVQPVSTSRVILTTHCESVKTLSLSHIINVCLVNKFKGGLPALHTASDSTRVAVPTLHTLKKDSYEGVSRLSVAPFTSTRPAYLTSYFYLFCYFLYIVAFIRYIWGTEWPFMCWYSVKRLLTHHGHGYCITCCACLLPVYHFAYPRRDGQAELPCWLVIAEPGTSLFVLTTYSCSDFQAPESFSNWCWICYTETVCDKFVCCILPIYG